MLRVSLMFLCVLLAAGCAGVERTPEEPERDASEVEALSDAEPSIEVRPLEEIETGEAEALPAPAEPEEPLQDADATRDETPAQDKAGAEEAGGTGGISRRAIQGRVTLSTASGTVGPAQYHDTVVYYVPDAGARAPEPGRFEIRTERKRFKPDVLVVPVGSTVAFPNDDDILHNVFSVSPNAEFDLGRYGLGESRSHTFDETGLALIHCDVHHAMQADVLVVDTPYYARAGDNGDFSLAGIPPGSGVLHVWHPRAGEITESISLPVDGQVAARLELTKPRVAAHVHKSGEPYRPRRRSDAPEGTGGVVAEEPAEDTASAMPSADSVALDGDNMIEGRVELAGDGEAPDPEQLRDVVVYFEPEAGSPPPAPGEYAIGTRNKTFMPDVLVIPAGSTVAFPNDDSILHSVFSVSPNAVFDLGRYGLGESRSHTFDEPGLALIHCDVHHHMQADVLVVDTPYYTTAGENGSFRLAGLPNGPGSLHIWHPRTEKVVEEIVLPRDVSVARRLEITKPRVPKHLDKFGEPYRERRKRGDES